MNTPTCNFSFGFNSNSKHLHAFAYHLTNDWHKAEDLYQETAFKAYKNKDKFSEGTNLKSWLLTVMRNIFISDYRKNKNRADLAPLYPSHENKNMTFNLGENNIAAQEILAVIDDLDQNMREPFMMTLLGYKYQEIAEHMGLPEGTVKSRVFVARKILRRSIRRN